MKRFKLNINGKEVFGVPSQTILDVAKENDIYIPTLCFDERTEIYGACGMCVVEVEGNPKLPKACATEISEGMVVRTNTPRVIESRKTNLELLLSNHVGDCRPPCVQACPANTDCQGYVGLIANGQFEEALKLIKEKIPFPAAIGRVCPHPCETACRRQLVEEPISIAWLKRFAADTDLLGEEPFIPEIMPETGKSVAVIGGGPGGLAAAFFLRKLGHAVTVFEAMPNFGGMLRYGIPEYRLPKELLDEEISLIGQMGVELKANTKIGRDIKFDALRKDYDAVFVAIGAWLSSGLRCKGEEADGVIGGIDFLRKVVRNEELKLGQKVAVVGGGNVAMDACRTAVRLGAQEVYNIYRRTVDEMPADQVEIEEAQEEGVIFKNLCNPMEVIKDENGHVKQVVLQKMRLGEPDASGRRSPVPIEGATETIDVDNIIVAIGQTVDPTGLEGLALTKKKGVVTDEQTFMTSIEGVFAGGDCFNDKITIAVEAIGHAEKAAKVIDAYLAGEKIKYVKPYIVEKTGLTSEDYEDRERKCRPQMSQLSPAERKDNFAEVVHGYTAEQAVADAERCLECGCHDYFECKLAKFANEYDVKPERLKGDISANDFPDDHPFIMRDPQKCILCGLCVRVCDEVMGVTALGLVARGFDAAVRPALENPLAESGCISCGQCISVCPTGALGERLKIAKPVPVRPDETDTICSFCSVGCSIRLQSKGDLLLRSLPIKEGAVNKGLLCGKGRFGFDLTQADAPLMFPRIKKDGKFVEVDYHEAFVYTAKSIQRTFTKYGRDKVAVAVSDRYTNEEAYAVKELTDVLGAKIFSFNNRKSGLKEVLGLDASPNTINELLATGLIVIAGFDPDDNPVLYLKIRQAAKLGIKVIAINPEGIQIPVAAQTVCPANDVSFLKEIAKALIDAGKAPARAEGFAEFKASLAGITVSSDAKEIADQYMAAKKAMIVFGQNFISTEAATLLADIAVISGHIGKARDGILQVKAKNNSQGLVDLGITAGKEAVKEAKALLIFGEDTDADLSGVDFLMVSDTHLTNTAKKADIVFPATGFATVNGTFTNTERRVQLVRQAVEATTPLSNWEIAAGIAHVFEHEMPYEDTADISYAMENALPYYRKAKIGEISDGFLYFDGFGFADQKAKLQTVAAGKFFEPLPNTDSLMNRITELLPKAK